jgi:CRISPR-associated protein Cas2
VRPEELTRDAAAGVTLFDNSLSQREQVMKVLIVYDVGTGDSGGPRRLRRVARACEDYGQRVQKSVFECSVGEAEWARLRARLLEEMDSARDSVRFYFLESDVRVEHHGAGEPWDMEGPLVV